ncbi:hypothetical protein JQ615_39825 [Bradyrhizobium jicamae]|uniref:Uncharacterized protein n=1 Tax=Bradyrhizobium jicamae TaxID=280332 RepID=A0ABS5FXI6_9BRAD|nr:hypothetical protein [Bradyrhizobium jicamae]MBR0801508.1 hypothetical protein [Bradyrhizobium jicamae]
MTATLTIDGLVLIGLLAATVGGSEATGNAVRFVIIALVAIIPIFALVCLLSGIPAAVTIWLSERASIRSAFFFIGAGGVIGALSQLLLFRGFAAIGFIFVLAGSLAGLEYWRIAGRYAGRDDESSREHP